MCLRLSINAIKHIAKEDIKVYKVLICKNGHLEAPIMDYKYTMNTLNVLNYPLRLLGSGNKVYIEDGFYSFISKTDAICYTFAFINARVCIVECTVPKGSEYYTDDITIVSNKLIVNKII